MSIVLSLPPVVVFAQTKEPFYLGDYKINCFVPQGNADMYLDTRDKGIVGHLCRGRGWEPAITNGMLNALQPSWTVACSATPFDCTTSPSPIAPAPWPSRARPIVQSLLPTATKQSAGGEALKRREG